MRLFFVILSSVFISLVSFKFYWDLYLVHSIGVGQKIVVIDVAEYVREVSDKESFEVINQRLGARIRQLEDSGYVVLSRQGVLGSPEVLEVSVYE